MSEAVLDASAILALINRETGCEKLTDAVLEHALASTVNLVEVQTKLIRRGWAPDRAWQDARDSVKHAVAFTSEMARLAGELTATTRSLSLSLGDRACLALALYLDYPLYTCDRVWAKLPLPLDIRVIR